MLSAASRGSVVGWLALALLAFGPAAARGQPAEDGAASTRLAAAAIHPDTVQVGEPFTLGVSIAGPETAEVEFPPLITLPPEIEQLRTVEVDWGPDGEGRWRARYPLVAWKAGSWTFGPLEVGRAGREIAISPPPVHVVSVLPAASEGPLPLEGPKEPRSTWRFPWWLLLLLLLALAAVRWLANRIRKPDEAAEVPWIDPADEAREALARLKRRLENGELDLAAYYDGLEEVLRSFLAARRGWPPERPVRDFMQEAPADEGTAPIVEGIRSLQGRAGLVRFAHVEAAESAALEDADACLAWIEAETAEAA